MKKQLGILFLLFGFQILQAQNPITVQQCEALFLKNNLVLLAEHYNIDAAKALTIQARIWDNPTFSADINLYNPERQKYFDVGKQGAKDFGINQIIYLGGKKAKEVNLAKKNEQIAELEFSDLLRTLKFQLRKSFFTVFYNSKNIETTDSQLGHIEKLIKSYSQQVEKGNLPLKDLVRLQSLYLDFKNERLEAINANYEEQANLKLLLNDASKIIPIVSDTDFDKYNKEQLFDVQSLQEKASLLRPDYLVKQKEIEANELNIKFQRSLAIPDANVGLSYSQRGSAFNNQKNINLSIPLPLWNKNKGNIAAAKVTWEQSKIDQQSATIGLQTEIFSILNKWTESRKSYSQIQLTSPEAFNQVYQSMLANFQKSNISILDFTDFMESYNQSSILLNELKKKVVLSAEELNATTNTELFK
ncbi:TolC family protein [Flavobacterium sp. 7A]|uniref:TolC family protein n=1 Tax=Flavobacterium sp. 7A TaxID=2940571 RepID=UPI002226F498|nr:TolC family protein [Flavobacterium sp. 7A]MCW2118992.1 cobalt-zinc-cadmium efflux system outer membrane protein [Flavobacterium sp. 7A]